MIEISTTAANDTPATSHICQIIAKPNSVATMEITKPEPVFLGMCRALKPASGRW
ncbi:hypothetical protein D3C85_1648930 [compost metagenome]